MRVLALKRSIDNLKCKYNLVESPSLLDKIKTSYYNSVLHELGQIIALAETSNGETAKLADNFTRFLKQNWSLIKDGSLCYTVIPTAEITLLLCDVASWVAEQKNEQASNEEETVHAIQLLMPSVAVESQNDTYPDLRAPTGFGLLKMLTHPQQCDFSELNNALQNKDGFVLYEEEVIHDPDLNAESSTPTDQEKETEIKEPKIKKTLFFISNTTQSIQEINLSREGDQGEESAEIAETADSRELIEKKAKLETLKSKCTTNFTIANPEELELIAFVTGRTANKELKKILKSHILGTAGDHLIPARLVAEIDLSPEIKRSRKPYYSEAETELQDTQNAIIELPEQEHTAWIQLLKRAERLRAQIENRDPLPISLAPITPHSLLTNDAYFVKNSEQQRLIGHSLLTKELQNAKLNFGQESSDTNTLLGRLTELCQVLYQNSAYVTGIHDNAAAGAYPAIITFIEYYNRLGESAKNRIPQGLLQQIEILRTLTTDRTQNVNATANIQTCIASRSDGIKRHMKGHETLLASISLVRTPSEIDAAKERFDTAKKNLLLALSATGEYVGRDLLTNNAPLLKKFSIRTILNTPPKVVTLEDFKHAFAPIPDEEKSAFLDMMQESWPQFVKSTADFRWVFENSSDDQKAKVFQSLTPLLPGIIKSVSDFRTIREYLSPEQNTTVFKQLKPALIASIRTANDFRAIREFFSPAQHAELLSTMKTLNPDVWIEITCERLVNSVKTSIVDGIHKTIHQMWINSKQKLVNSQYPQRREPVTRRAEHLGWWSNTITTTMEWTNSHLQDREHEMNHYRTVFQNEVSPRYKQKINNQIDSFSPGALLNKLFKRHPWLLHDRESNIVQSYLTSVLNENLLSCFRKPLSNWEFLPLEIIDTGNFNWNPIDQALLTKKIEGYPLSNVKAFYLDQVLRNNPSLNTNILTDQYEPEKWLYWRFTRIDLFRLMTQQYPEAMQPSSIDGVICTSMAPKHMDELRHLSPTQLQHFKILMVNVGSEDNSTWITLSQNQMSQIWTAYIPKIEEDNPLYIQCQIGIRTIQTIIPSLSIVRIDYTNNVLLNDIEMPDPVTQWHAVVLGRILPGCQQSKMPLSTYRSNVPLSIMLQQSLVDCEVSEAALYNINNAFSLRAPVSNFQEDRLIPYPHNIQHLFDLNNHSLIHYTFQNKKCASSMLRNFDQNTLLLEKEPNRWVLTLTGSSKELIINMFQLIYHTPVGCLQFTPYSTHMQDMNNLFNYDINLTTIKTHPSSKTKSELFNHASLCAARNRFLATIDPQRLSDARNDVNARQVLWLSMGKQIFDFFRNNQSRIDIDFINDINAFNPNWHKAHCDNELRNNLDDVHWAFAQIAQMGIEGLNQLFNYLNETYVDKWEADYKEPAPNLACTLDLSGSAAAGNPSLYIQHLTSKIKAFDRAGKGCSPLFSSLSLMLPQPMDLECQQALLELMGALNQQKLKFPNEANEVVLCNLDIQNPIKHTEHFINQLMSLANKGFSLLVRLPDWDRDAFDDKAKRTLKSSYRAVQNKILDNQRAQRSATLGKNTENSYAVAEGRLRPDIVFDYRLAQQLQPWEEAETWYPLTAQSNNIQHQMEQQQEQQQEEKTRTVPEQEQDDPPPPINPYLNDETDLITRDTIDAQCTTKWAAVDPAIQTLSGWDHKNLNQLFSLWVGSTENAEDVIEKIEPSAVQKIMLHATKFRLGVNKDNLPAGFYLARSTATQGLVLCFDHEHERKDLLKIAQLAPKLRNPFTIELDTPKPALYFRGDFRQLNPFCKEPADQQAMWNCLATEDSDSVRLDNAIHCLNKTDLKTLRNNVSVIMQRFDALNELAQPSKNTIEIIQRWAHQSGASPELLNALFNPTSSAELSPSNLKALGQLFYHYDNADADTKGAQHWLHVTQQLFNAFGPEGLSIWKKRILDPSKNWSELLNKEEVDAIALSIATLKEIPTQQRIFWKLVDAHGQAVGTMRFATLWFAYQKLLKSASDNSWVMDEESITRYLDNTTNFNGQVFLDRLCSVLKSSTNELHGDVIGQTLLNQIDKVDWRHNGFYYANRYTNYPYWDEALRLNNFNATSKRHSIDYKAQWSPLDEIDLPVNHALRFAGHRIRLNIEEFHLYKKILLTCCKNKPQENMPLRLLTGCLAIGADSVENLNAETMSNYLVEVAQINPSLLSWLNQQFNLDGKLQSNLIQIHWADIVPFATAMSRFPELQGKILSMEGALTIELLNHYGRALHCYRYSKRSDEKFEKLLAFTQKHDTSHPLCTTYPWLIERYSLATDPIGLTNAVSDDAQQQIALFQTQLRTIQFEKTRVWPTQNELHKAFTKIAKAENPVATRREIVTEWIANGTPITYQESKYRPINPQETKQAIQYFDQCLKGNFKSLNFPLCQRFIKNYVALKTNGNHTAQLNEIMSVLVRLDNKTHYNELGQILGVLMTHANTTYPRRFYSAPQLCAWLNALVNESKYHQHHYPINMLAELLASSQAKSLCNSNLDALSYVISDQLKSTIQEITAAPLLDKYKPVLVKLALQPNCDLDYVHQSKNILIQLQQKGIDSIYLDAVSKLVIHLASLTYRDRILSTLTTLRPSSDPLISKMFHLDAVSKTVIHLASLNYRDRILSTLTTLRPSSDPLISKMWEKSQVVLIKRFIKGLISRDDLSNLTSFDTSINFRIPINSRAQYIQDNTNYIQIILTQVLGNNPLDDKLFAIRRMLSTCSLRELELLIHYYASKPRPSMIELHDLLNRLESPQYTRYSDNKANDLIHHFESVVQANNKHGHSKRHYSITENDHKSLLRVLAGIKRKGQGYIADHEQKELLNLSNYTNSYAQVAALSELRMSDLLTELHTALSDIKAPDISTNAKNQASARLLACMREVLLRKTGKWANHTQMLDLLYAAVHNDDSLLHQLQTGQGKSIITVMRTAYLALNGAVVDVFSAKDSLSRRDHKEFSPVLDAMEIRNGYITANSEATEYHDTVQNGVGAVNYATMGNFSLFISHHIWKSQSQINLDAAYRVAFLDEADHVLDEQTQFNFSDNDDGDGAYNLDEWVYQAVNEFYLEHRNSFPCDPVTNIMRVSNKPHLKLLYEFLQRRAVHSPENSKFFDRYITPAVSKIPALIKKRDNQLLQLLTANHTAQHLREGVGYCIRPEIKTVGDTVFHTRFAKVMIENQIREGSTYSDLVQQFLHVRLNREAVEKSESPNFFVEPSSQIALSQNVPYLLKKYYYKLEGCTGTIGNKSNQARYAGNFGIQQFIKLPTHEEKRSQVLPTEYCDTEDAQIEAIAKHILNFRDRPILITCEDDIAVKKIAQLVRQKLFLLAPEFTLSAMIVDTNDSGKDENEVVPNAGRAGAVTFSGRMGRGTDIQPETEQGLMVIRSYPTRPSIAKQEHGRQGRNGACGTCVDVINYGASRQEYEQFSRLNTSRLQKIMTEQATHLDKKLAKYVKLNRKKSSSVENREMYLITRATEQLKHELRKEQKMYIERKNALMAALSGNVMDVLKINNTESLRSGWIACRKEIDLIWNRRLAGDKRDSDDVYAAFLADANKVWLELNSTEKALNANIINTMDLPATPVESAPFTEEPTAQHPDMPAIAAFYQQWVDGAEKAYFNKARDVASKDVVTAIYGAKHADLNAIYELLKSVGIDKFMDQQIALFTSLQKVIKNDGAYAVSFSSYASLIRQLVPMFEAKDYPKCLAGLEAFFEQPWLNKKRAAKRTSNEIEKISLLSTMIMTIVTKKYTRDDIGKDDVSLFVKMISEVIYQGFWDDFDGNFASRVISIFASDEDITSLLTSNTNKSDLHRCIELIHSSRLWPNQGVDRRTDLCAYLKKEANNLSAHPEAIKPVFSLLLAGRKSIDPATTLPSPLPCHGDQPLAANEKMLAALWHFFSQRTPITETSSKTLIDILTAQQSSPDFLKVIIKELNAIPPYIELDYINKELLGSTGRFNIDDCHVRLKATRRAAFEWCNFMASRNLIQSHHEFIHPENQHMNNFGQFYSCFNEMSPERNQLFFAEVAKYPGVDLSIIQKYAIVFSKDATVNKAELQRMLDLAQAIQTLPAESRQFINDELRNILSTNQQQFKIRLQEFEVFVASLNEKVSPSELELSAVKKLWTKRLTDRSDLYRAIDVIQLAMRLKSQENWADFFSSIDCQRKYERQLIMQYLEHDIVDLGVTFKNRCYREYQALCTKLPAFGGNRNSAAHSLSFHTSKVEARHQLLKDMIKPVMKLVREIVNIAENPYPHLNKTAVPRQLYLYRCNRYSDYTDHQYNRYKSYWWVSKSRRSQAKEMFSKLSSICEYSHADYYREALNTIWKSQKIILLSDKDSSSTQNKKGYSRLYDISVQMFFHLAKECLQNPDVTFEEKQQYNQMFHEQLQFHIDELHARLPEKSGLKERITDLKTRLLNPRELWKPGSTELADLKNDIATYRNNIPKNLYYLLPQIDIATELLGQNENDTPAARP